MKLVRFLEQGRPICGTANDDEVAELEGDFFSPFKLAKTRRSLSGAPSGSARAAARR